MPVPSVVLRSRGALLWGALAITGCAAHPSPKTVVDSVARADVPTTSDGAPSQPSQREGSAEVEPVAIAIPDSGLVEAKAAVNVGAPMAKVRAAIHAFEEYPQFMPEYSDAARRGRLPSGNEKVYMEITTLGGIAKMFANIEVLPVRTEGDAEIHEAKFIDGNVRQFKAIWTIAPQGADRTHLTLQVFLHPSLPLPDFLVNKANLDGAKKGVLAMKRRAEQAP